MNEPTSIDPYKRDLDYYETIDKVYWVPVSDILLNDGGIIRWNKPIPCLFVEVRDDNLYILQFDISIEFDIWRYTAWRKVIGVSHEIRVDVLLIQDNKLYTLEGQNVDFNSLGRSTVLIDKEFLGKCGIKD